MYNWNLFTLGIQVLILLSFVISIVMLFAIPIYKDRRSVRRLIGGSIFLYLHWLALVGSNKSVQKFIEETNDTILSSIERLFYPDWFPLAFAAGLIGLMLLMLSVRAFVKRGSEAKPPN